MSNSQNSAGMLAASELDIKGNYAEALEILKSASLQGDLPAMTELAHRLLVGDRAPKSPKHALYFLRESAKQNEARALSRLATLTAAGAYVPQNWQQALSLLGKAATYGDLSAQGQILCLQPAEAKTSTWEDMAQRIPIHFWLQAAKEEEIHSKVRHIPDLVPLPVCTWLINRGQGRLQPSLVYDSVSKENQLHEMRTNTMALFDYASFDLVQFLVQERMARTCSYPIQNFEAPMVLHYDVGQQITPHFDFIDSNASDYNEQISEHGQRMITFLLYLNDDYLGGETTFPVLDISHRGKTGGGLYFINAHNDLSPDRDMLHTGSPPSQGEKWIVSQFIVSKRLRP